MTLRAKALLTLFSLLSLPSLAFMKWELQGLLWGYFIFFKLIILFIASLRKEQKKFFQFKKAQGKTLLGLRKHIALLCEKKQQPQPNIYVIESNLPFISFWGISELHIFISKQWTESFSLNEQLALIDWVLTCFHKPGFKILQSILTLQFYIYFKCATFLNRALNASFGIFSNQIFNPEGHNFITSSCCLIIQAHLGIIRINSFFTKVSESTHLPQLEIQKALWKQELLMQTQPLKTPFYLVLTYPVNSLTKYGYHRYLQSHPQYSLKET